MRAALGMTAASHGFSLPPPGALRSLPRLTAFPEAGYRDLLELLSEIASTAKSIVAAAAFGSPGCELSSEMNRATGSSTTKRPSRATLERVAQSHVSVEGPLRSIEDCCSLSPRQKRPGGQISGQGATSGGGSHMSVRNRYLYRQFGCTDHSQRPAWPATWENPEPVSTTLSGVTAATGSIYTGFLENEFRDNYTPSVSFSERSACPAGARSAGQMPEGAKRSGEKHNRGGASRSWF